MARWLAAAALVALTLFAWDVPDCPFCQQTAHYASHSIDLDFFFLEPEPLPEVAFAAAPIDVELDTPVFVAASWVPLVRAPKQGPPDAEG